MTASTPGSHESVDGHDAAVVHAATAFRHALDLGDLKWQSLAKFPRGSCGDASVLLGAYLEHRVLGAWTYRSGIRNLGNGRNPTHAWIEQKELIVDITADQFEGEGLPAVLVTRDRTWHDQWSRMAGSKLADISYFRNHYGAEVIKRDYALLATRADQTLGAVDGDSL